MDCSIVIPHYNQVSHLNACIRAILSNEVDYSYEIIVVDVDDIGITSLSLQPHMSDIKWISTKEKNPYVSRNKGILAAMSQNIILLDAKCIPDPGFIMAAVTALHKDDSIIAGPYEVVSKSEKIRDKVYGIFYLQTLKNIEKGYGVTAGNLGFKKEVFDDVGPFDTTFYSGSDIAWSKTALALGYKIKYVRGMKVGYPGQSWPEMRKSTIKYMSGILHHQQQERWPLLKRMRYGLSYLFPMRPSTYRSALSARPSVSSAQDKWYLWLKVWQAKIGMAYHYFMSMLRYERKA